jgi:hypothetical protein
MAPSLKATGTDRPSPQVVCWHSASAEVSASGVASASCYDLPENVGVVAIIVSERKLIQIQRQIFLADISGILPYAKLSS